MVTLQCCQNPPPHAFEKHLNVTSPSPPKVGQGCSNCCPICPCSKGVGSLFPTLPPSFSVLFPTVCLEMRDSPLVAGGTHPENAGAAAGKEPLPQQRKATRKKELRDAPSQQRPPPLPSAAAPAAAHPVRDCQLRASINASQ